MFVPEAQLAKVFVINNLYRPLKSTTLLYGLFIYNLI